MQVTKNEVSSALRALEVVILDPRVDTLKEAAIIKAVFRAIMPSRRKLQKAKQQMEANQCGKTLTS